MALKLRVATLRNKKSIFPSHTLPRFHKYGLLPPKTNPRKQSLSSLSQRKIESQPGTHAGNRRTDTQPRSGGRGGGSGSDGTTCFIHTAGRAGRCRQGGRSGSAGSGAAPSPPRFPPHPHSVPFLLTFARFPTKKLLRFRDVCSVSRSSNAYNTTLQPKNPIN